MKKTLLSFLLVLVAAAGNSAAVLPNTMGAQKTLVLLVNFQDQAIQPVSVSDANGLFFTNAMSVSNYWMENSFGQTWLTGDVFGWYTLPLSSTGCDPNSIASAADSAAASAGVNVNSYPHRVYIFPNNGCGFWGQSNVGGNPSRSWIRLYNNALSGMAVQTLAHELGHALGLYHSHGLDCGTVTLAGSGCGNNEYGDTFDYMGNLNYLNAGDYNAFQKERLGWLNNGSQPPIQMVSVSGTYTLTQYESQDSGVKALKILASGSTGTYYYVEFRSAIGFDSYNTSQFGGPAEVVPAVFVHRGVPTDGTSSYLLNMAPANTSWSSPGLATGGVFTDPSANITITAVSIGSTAVVQVALGSGAPSCTHANPALSMAGPSSSVAPGATASFDVTVSNNDSSACAASTFNLGNSVPSGWSASYGGSAINIVPGGNATVTLSVTNPSGTANGTYAVTSSAVNSSASAFSASANGSETVYQAVAPPPPPPPPPPPATTQNTVSVSTNSTSYTLGQQVSTTVSVSNNGSPVSGAAVSVKLTKPTGATVSLSSTTGSDGMATVNYQLKKRDPKGTWQVSAASGTSASSSFIVH